MHNCVMHKCADRNRVSVRFAHSVEELCAKSPRMFEV